MHLYAYNRNKQHRLPNEWGTGAHCVSYVVSVGLFCWYIG